MGSTQGNARAVSALEKVMEEEAPQQQQEDVAGKATHGQGDPGHGQTDATFDQADRVMNTLVSLAKVKLTSTRDRIDTCLRGIDDRKVQLAEDLASFRDELKEAETMASSIDVSLEGVTKVLSRHIEPRPASVTHLRRSA